MERKTSPTLSKDQSGLLKFWISKCQNGHLPLRRDVSPAELVFCLPSISIVERRACGTDVFRLTASSLRDLLGDECRGQLLENVCGRMLPWYEAINKAIESNSPVIGQSPIGHLRSHQWMRLPLEPLENGRQPVLCYDRVVTLDRKASVSRETMFVTANAFKVDRQLVHSTA
jgi:Uncharacterized protein conserved in bacteria